MVVARDQRTHPAVVTRWWTIGDAAALLGVSTSTLRRWDGRGRLTADRDPRTGHRRYAEATLLAQPELAAGDAARVRVYTALSRLRLEGGDLEGTADALEAAHTALVGADLEEGDRLRAELAFVDARLAFLLGGLVAGLRAMHRVADLSARWGHDDLARRSGAAALRAEAFLGRDVKRDAVKLLDQARDAGDAGVELEVLTSLALQDQAFGRLTWAESRFREVVRLAAASGLSEPAALGWLGLAAVALERRDVSRCLDAARQVLALRPDEGDALRQRAAALLDLAMVVAGDREPSPLASEPLHPVPQAIREVTQALRQGLPVSAEEPADPLLRSVYRLVGLLG